jgi:hypothetical protein
LRPVLERAAPGHGGGSSRLCIGHQLDIEPSKDTSIRLPLEESDRLALSTHCLAPSRQGEPFNLVTSIDQAHTTVVLRRSVSDRLESPRADPVPHCSGRRIYGCLNPCTFPAAGSPGSRRDTGMSGGLAIFEVTGRASFRPFPRPTARARWPGQPVRFVVP